MNETWIDRVREWMEKSGTSQGRMAQALECTRGAVGHYLTGRRQPTLFQLERIAHVIGVHPAWLLYGVGPAASVAETPRSPDAAETQPMLPIKSGSVSSVSSVPSGRVLLGPLLDRCYGLRVDPGSGTPRAYEGETLVFDPDSTPHPGDEVLVGFRNGETSLFELITTEGDQIILGAVYDRRVRRAFAVDDIAYMHRVIAVLRRDALPLRPFPDE